MLDKVSSWLDEKVPANVWFVTLDTVFPCVPLGMALWVIQQPVAPESNKHNNGFSKNSLRYIFFVRSAVIGMSLVLFCFLMGSVVC